MNNTLKKVIEWTTSKMTKIYTAAGLIQTNYLRLTKVAIYFKKLMFLKRSFS